MIYPNYRVSVEIYLVKDNKALICKRVPKSDVNPGTWSPSAGKVRYTEIPLDAVVREAKEELNLDVKVTKELHCRAVTLISGEEEAYRLLYSYQVEQLNDKQEIMLNDEHTEYQWVSKEDLDLPDYSSLYKKQKEIIKEILK